MIADEQILENKGYRCEDFTYRIGGSEDQEETYETIYVDQQNNTFIHFNWYAKKWFRGNYRKLNYTEGLPDVDDMELILNIMDL